MSKTTRDPNGKSDREIAIDTWLMVAEINGRCLERGPRCEARFTRLEAAPANGLTLRVSQKGMLAFVHRVWPVVLTALLTATGIRVGGCLNPSTAGQPEQQAPAQK